MRRPHKGMRQRQELELRTKRRIQYQEEIVKIEKYLKGKKGEYTLSRARAGHSVPDEMYIFNHLRFLKMKVARIAAL